MSVFIGNIILKMQQKMFNIILILIDHVSNPYFSSKKWSRLDNYFHHFIVTTNYLHEDWSVTVFLPM